MQFRLVLPAILVGAAAFYSAACAGSDSILDTLPGQWVDVDRKYCAIGRMTVSVSEDGKRVDFVHSALGLATPTDARDRFSYRVGEQRGNRLRLDMENETRLDDDGNVVSWDLILLSKNEFCWNRSDWPEDGCTVSTFRCEG